jgi:uncharacterized protein
MKQDRRFVTGGAELRAGQSQGDEGALVVTGRAIAYGKRSIRGVPCAGARETIARGAFRESLAKQPVCADYNHSLDFLPLGSTKNGTLRLDDRDDGLHFELRLNPKIKSHADIYQLVKDGTLSELSFAFGNATDAWSNTTDDEDKSPVMLRTVRKADLYGISLVNSPAYTGVSYAEARSMAYAFGPAVRPKMSDAQLRARVAELGRQIEYDSAMDAVERSRRTGFIAVRTGPGEADIRYEVMTDEEYRRHLRRRADALGRQIRADILQSESEEPTFCWDERQGIWVSRLEQLLKEN